MSAGGRLCTSQENPHFWVPTIKVRPPVGMLSYVVQAAECSRSCRARQSSWYPTLLSIRDSRTTFLASEREMPLREASWSGSQIHDGRKNHRRTQRDLRKVSSPPWNLRIFADVYCMVQAYVLNASCWLFSSNGTDFEQTRIFLKYRGWSLLLFEREQIAVRRDAFRGFGLWNLKTGGISISGTGWDVEKLRTNEHTLDKKKSRNRRMGEKPFVHTMWMYLWSTANIHSGRAD
jgi:hypothetical protein